MKKTVVLLCMGILLSMCTVSGCSSTPSPDTQNTVTSTEKPTDAPSVPDKNATLSGGFIVSERVKSQLTKSQFKTFEKGTKDYTDKILSPLAVISQQVVWGVNFAYLCQGTTKGDTPQKSWDIVTIYEDSHGDDSLLSVNSIVLDNIHILDKKEDENLGIFKDVTAERDGSFDDDVKNAIKSALKNSKKEYTLLTLLGSRQDDKTIYKVFAQQDNSGSVDNCILTVSVDKDGNSTLDKTELFDINAYIGYDDEE